MITEENLTKLYQEVIEGKKLTTKELNSYGFNSKDLKKLIEEGKLERVKIGLYRFIDAKALFIEGKKYLKTKEYGKSNLYFEKSYELDNTNLKVAFELFVDSIVAKDYDKTLKYYEVLVNTKNPYYIPDYYTYLYLLNSITELPKNYQEQVKKMTLADISLYTNDKRYKDTLSQNKIRKSIISKNFKFALKQLNDFTQKQKENTIYDILLRTLIIEAIEKENIERANIIKLLKEKNYQEIINLLKEKEQRETLSYLEQNIIKLSETIISIINKKEIPLIDNTYTENIYEAIQRNNYELAYQINKSNSQKYNINIDNDILNILLTEIKNLTKTKEEPKIENKKNIEITDIINDLIQNDIDKAYNSIKEYLTINNHKEYELLINNLIKVSILEKDITYSKAIIALINLNRTDYQFDISKYIEEFYISLSQNKFEIAKVYLDIIKHSKNLGQECIFTDNLIKVLEQAENAVNKKINVIKEEMIVEKTTIEKPQEVNKSVSKESKKTYEVRNSEKEFIESKYQKLLLDKGILLLKPMNAERRRNIYSIVKTYGDMVAYSIGEGETKPVVLRYRPQLEERYDPKKLIIDGNNAYNEQNYDECIDCYLKILSFGKPRTSAFAKLGLAYMKKFKLDKAIEYLTVATYMAKENNENYDFTELIDRLKGNTDEDAKPRFIMKESDFKNDLDNHYGITNFDEINTLITDGYLDVDSACENLNIEEEQKTRLKLLYAKLYYSYGEYEIGDSFINDVEKTNDKSNFVKKELETIKKNKRFYINREKTIESKLSLSLKPKK